MNGICLAIVGISGAGKTLYATRFAENRLGYKVVSASAIIKRFKLESPTPQKWLENQEIIAEQISSIARRYRRTILVDAHCSVEFREDILDVPLGVFKKIKVRGFVVVNRSASEILHSRKVDDRRKRREISEPQLTHMLEHELHVAKRYASAMGVPCVIVADYREFAQGILSISRKVPTLKKGLFFAGRTSRRIAS